MKYFLILTMILMGCEKDPYPEGGVRKEPRQEQQEPRDNFGMTVERSYDFKEGKRKSFKIGVFVEAPGKPDLTVKNLPEGAEYDPETFTITWMPGPFQGNDLSDPTIKSRKYFIDLLLRNTNDIDGDTITRTVLLVVNDVPRKFEIKGSDSQVVYEGSEFRYEFEMDNVDYPNGPFAVNAANLPANTSIEQINDKRYRLVFTPDHNHVKLNERQEAKYETKLSVYNPANHLTEKIVNITVRDKRLGVKVVTPGTVEQGLDSTFQISAYDLNSEVAPTIELEGSRPDFGEFDTKLKQDEQNNSSVLNVSWKDIPPSYNGKSKTFRFEACVYDGVRRYRNCKSSTATLNIRVKDRNPPLFSRHAWKAGEIKFLKFNEPLRVNISAQDGDNSQDVSKIKIVPKEMQKYVSWNNGRLVVKADKPGTHQFSLVATSEYNMSTAESFVFKVFKKDRSEILYFTDSTRDKEVQFFRKNLPNVELWNPAIQVLDDEALAGRETIVLGTSILFDTQMQVPIERAFQEIDNVIVASPMVSNLPTSFLDMIEDKLKVTVVGRYSQLPTNTKLNKLYFVKRADFARNQDKVRLAGNASMESADPVVFHEGVETQFCDDVLELNDDFAPQKKKYTIGIICKMPNGGRLALLGTEFADLKVSERDKDIPSQWFNNMLKLRVGGNR